VSVAAAVLSPYRSTPMLADYPSSAQIADLSDLEISIFVQDSQIGDWTYHRAFDIPFLLFSLYLSVLLFVVIATIFDN